MISDGISMYALGLVYCFNVAVRIVEIPYHSQGKTQVQSPEQASNVRCRCNWLRAAGHYIHNIYLPVHEIMTSDVPNMIN